jgi:hypothetical protein
MKIRQRDCLIPLSAAHLRVILKSRIGHYNQGRAHMASGPGVPDPAIRENAHTRAGKYGCRSGRLLSIIVSTTMISFT